MTLSIDVRLASGEDLEALKGNAAQDSELDRGDFHRRKLLASLPKPSAAWVAHLSVHGMTEAVGFAELVVIPGLALLSALWVEPVARRVGVGHVLITQVGQWCAERELGPLVALARPGDRESKNFCESHGLSAQLILMGSAGD